MSTIFLMLQSVIDPMSSLQFIKNNSECNRPCESLRQQSGKWSKRKRSTGLYLPVEIKLTTTAASQEPWFNSSDAASQQQPLLAFIMVEMFSHAANWLLDEALQTTLYSLPFDFYTSRALKACLSEKNKRLVSGGNGTFLQRAAMHLDTSLTKKKPVHKYRLWAQLLCTALV